MLTQILVNSVLSALILSLVALGFNLIFNATKVFHLAHGAMYVCAVLAVFQFNMLFQRIIPKDISIIISILLSLILISILIIVIEYLIYRPLYKKNANPIISLVSSLGVYFMIISIITLFFGTESISLNKGYTIIISNDWIKLTDIELVHLVIGSALIVIVIFFTKTTFYTHIRAITDNYSIAQKYGINVQRTRFIALIVGTLLVGMAGILKGYEIAIDPYVGLSITLAASIAVIVGGVNSLAGTILACFGIALIENFSVKFLSTQWKDTLTNTLLIVVLIFYQQGLISIKQRIEIR